MLIKSISMKNFQCYHGDHEDNLLHFKNGINLIVGDNGGGKSKLYDAFYWVLYDEIFSSDERTFKKTKQYSENLISDKAKTRCDIGQLLTAEVILIAEDSRNIEFRITRMFRALKIDDRDWAGEQSSKLMIEENKVSRWQSVPSESHESILNRVIEPHIKPYMWFQGEQVDSLMDFQSKSSLMQAINLLSDISEYDDLVEIAKKGYEKSLKDYTKETNKLSKNQKESKRLSADLERVRKAIVIVNESIELHTLDKNEAQINVDRLINQIDDATKKAELKQDMASTVRRIDANKKSLDIKIEGLNKNLFSNYWLLKNSQQHFDNFADKYNSYFRSHTEKIAIGDNNLIKLPIDIPQPIHVNEMLADEKCFVCGRDAHKGSEAHNHIKNLLRRTKPDSTDVFTCDCSDFFARIYTNSVSFKHTIKNIDKRVSEEFKDIHDLRSSISKNAENLKGIQEQFDELIRDDRSEDIVKEFKTHTNNIERYGKLLTDDELKLKDNINREIRIEAALKKLVVGSVDKVTEVSRAVYKDLSQLTQSTRKDVFSQLVKELEDSANKIYQDMASKNTAITGQIKLKMLTNESCIPEIVDGEGFIMSGSNDSNIILIKLALIMSVVTSKAQWSDNYCLISDAPTSKMSEKYTYGFYKALGDHFKQSIIMTYDFLDDNDRKVLNDFNLGSVHKIESVYPGGNKDDRTDLHINISQVSL